MSILLLIVGLALLILLSIAITSASPALVTVVEYGTVCSVYSYKYELGMSYTKLVFVPPDSYSRIGHEKR